MTYAEAVTKFLAGVAKIKSLNPKYRQPGDGSDGTCDCIGLVIGAIRRMGLKWTGIHGSNWAARKEFVELKRITNASQLELGDVVLKAAEQGEKGWALPTRYRKGGKYYNGDLRDYYHAGVVTSVNPFHITHMSTRITVDTKLGKWNYGGKLRILANASKGGVTPTPSPDTPTTGSAAVVTAPTGSTVNFRRSPSLKGALIKRIPIGTTVEIVSPGEEWASIRYNNQTGYMMAKFLDIIGDGKGRY